MSRGRQEDLYRGSGVSRIFAARMAFRRVSLRWKRYAFSAVLLAIFFFSLITGAMSMYYAGAVIHPKQTKAPPINKNLAYPYYSVSFKSRDETAQLYGWHFNARKTDCALIIVHGFGGNRFPFGADTLALIDAVIKIDFNVLVFDLRNSGSSEQGVSAFGLHEKNDVLGAIDYMRGAGYTQIALLGLSTGANAAAMAGAETAIEEVGALILDSPIIDMRQFILRLVNELNPGLPEFPFAYAVPMMVGLYLNGDVLDANVSRNLDIFLPRPVQLIHGNNDEIVSMADIISLYDAYMSRAVGQISIWNLPGAGHEGCFDYARDEYVERVTAFLRKVFL